MHGMNPPSSYQHIDVLKVSKKHFSFTSHKLEHMTDILCTKYKKLKHSEFSGFTLWRECLNKNMKAFESMEKYNKYDVLSLEELYTKIAPWGVGAINLDLLETSNTKCKVCGADDSIIKNGFSYTKVGKFQRYKCVSCGHETRDGVNLYKDNKFNRRGTR